ncbi:unnamed protein product [Brassicogethes aeneus]|uniref:Uncharacterized protein n=1 Tax=Brassicogethes aeneus TaxID=1431903 RepID=A0A9P0FLA2_BRAAE|nr:unnamed protein product [Brassicogethes aeneus]
MSAKEAQSFALVSDEFTHEKISVYKFIERLLELITEDYDEVAEVKIFPNGAASQFKQKYLFSNLHVFEARYDIKLSCHFFASGHGKGVVDAIGGRIKGSVWRRQKAELW